MLCVVVSYSRGDEVLCVCTGSVCSGGGGAGDVCCVCVQGVCAPGEVELVMFVVCVFRECVLWGRWSR